MAVRSAFPILSTRDLERLEAFYGTAFGAERTYAFADEGRDVYVALSLGDSALGIGRDDSLDAAPGGAALWLDVDDAYRRALGAGATSVAGPAVMPWGERVAQVRDPDGFVVHLGSPAP
ncbi:extradiol dioxygenase [Aeromicrobium flavum]|uniref:Extradiol dioxygenase n=1 Tax=Aeromicrobium flavum TaxID=416568 RepID=A0A512HYM9_9ACTN|nr:VOC family protein [Aeromicrobium flavum]GEO90561.1 extradiol dioxygenase [Aeromicrobium flavum]